MRKRASRRYLAVAGVLAVLTSWALPNEAEACSRAMMAWPQHPRPNAVDVPVDVVIKLDSNSPVAQQGGIRTFVLEALDPAGAGVVVPVTVEELPSAHADRFPIRVRPDAPLQPSTRHRLIWPEGFAPDMEFLFETGSGQSAPAPSPPTPAVSVIRYDPMPTQCVDTCWPYGVGGVELDFGGEAAATSFSAPPGGLTFNVYEGGNLIAGDLPSKGLLQVRCGSSGAPGLAPGHHALEVRTVNAAGQLSLPLALQLEAVCEVNPGGNSPMCGTGNSTFGCTAAPPSFALLLGALVVALPGRRRSRPR